MAMADVYKNRRVKDEAYREEVLRLYDDYLEKLQGTGSKGEGAMERMNSKLSGSVRGHFAMKMGEKLYTDLGDKKRAEVSLTFSHYLYLILRHIS